MGLFASAQPCEWESALATASKGSEKPENEEIKDKLAQSQRRMVIVRYVF
jgi:hypothetical protein